MNAEKLAADIRTHGFGGAQMAPVLECLDRLIGIENAALPANVAAIRREHISVNYEQGLSGSEANEAHRNRGVLLEIVRLQVLLIAGLKRQVEESDRRLKVAFDNERRLQQRPEERAIAKERERVAVLSDALQRYRRVLCPEARIVGQTEAGARLDVDEWEKEHAREFPLPRL